jgi:arylsulfatase
MTNRDPKQANTAPFWPAGPKPPEGAPNIVVILFDDVGFSDFGCYGSPIQTPNIDALAAEGLRYTGFHTTAMCSTTRAALLTGRNHHSVGMGCLANFDSGYPGYRGKISKEAGTLAEMLRPHGYRNYMVGKWHVTPTYEVGPAGPTDGWPLGRGFDRYYGFMDAETDQYSPELVRDNTPITPPGTYETGYHLTDDLTREAIRYVADHHAAKPDAPFLLWVAFGACHAPHQAPRETILKYDDVFKDGWDAERERRLARQIEMGIVPKGTKLPPANDWVAPWANLKPDEQRLFTRLQSAFAGMLDHTDAAIGRLITFLKTAGYDENTVVLVLSDNGASQEGGPFGFINAMGPYNWRQEPMEEKLARIDDIGGPDTHSNFPLGWAQASNTPLKRYKQNTHGGGIRDPLVITWPKGIKAKGELRHQFCHASDFAPTLLDIVGITAPETVNGVPQMPLEGTSFATSLTDASAPSKGKPQYFEMFGHRGIVQNGWKAVAYHPPGKPYADDKWELYHLAEDFNEFTDLADSKPEKLAELIDLWWQEADAHQVLPLDDRFGERFAENAARHLGDRRVFTFHNGMGHLPTDVSPDLRSRSYTIDAAVEVTENASGILISHGDATCGYALYMQDGFLIHDVNVGQHQILRSTRPVPAGRHTLSFRAQRSGTNLGDRIIGTLLIDGQEAGKAAFAYGFVNFVSWSGIDIGMSRGSPVSHYKSPFKFNGLLRNVTVTIEPDQVLDSEAAAAVVLARE